MVLCRGSGPRKVHCRTLPRYNALCWGHRTVALHCGEELHCTMYSTLMYSTQCRATVLHCGAEVMYCNTVPEYTAAM